MSADNEKLSISVSELRELLFKAAQPQEISFIPAFDRLSPEQLVELAKGQFPQLEVQLAIQHGIERTKRLLIVVAGICLITGAALCVFAPTGKETVSYIVATVLAILPLGAIGVQEFRLRSLGVLSVDAGKAAVESAARNPST